MTPEDEELWKLVENFKKSQGDEDFRKIVKRVSPFLRHLLQGFYVNDYDAVNDAMQDVWVKVLRNLETIKPTGSFLSFCLTVATRHAINDRKRAKRIDYRPPDSFYDISNDFRFDLAPGELEKLECINSVIDQLPEKDAIVLRLHFIKGLSFEEIGKAMGEHTATIYRRYERALPKLRKIYAVRCQ
jgi:RNA polymerase sigma-70 factor (ECF subfamily)